MKEKKNIRRPKPKSLAAGNDGRSPYYFRRVLAFAGDFFLTNRMSVMIAAIVYGCMNGGDITLLSSLSDLPAAQMYTILAIILAANLWYFVYIPVKVWPGQTPLQRLLQVRVLADDGGNASWKTMLYRFVIGCLILEGTFYDCTSVFKNALISRYFPANIDTMDLVFSAPIILLCVLSIIMSLRDQNTCKTLHDKISHTYVKDMYVAK